jgi:hypothetical protein
MAIEIVFPPVKKDEDAVKGLDEVLLQTFSGSIPGILRAARGRVVDQDGQDVSTAFKEVLFLGRHILRFAGVISVLMSSRMGKARKLLQFSLISGILCL